MSRNKNPFAHLPEAKQRQIERYLETHDSVPASMLYDDTPIERGTANPQAAPTNAFARVRKGKPPDLPCAVRSAWEANVYRVLLWQAENKFTPVSAVFYEPMRLWFPREEGTRQYNPDFMIVTSEVDQGWRYVEVKGRNYAKGWTQLKMFKRFYPQEFRNMLFIVGSEALRKKIRGLGDVEVVLYSEYKTAFGSFVNWQSAAQWDDMMRMFELAEDDERAGPTPF